MTAPKGLGLDATIIAERAARGAGAQTLAFLTGYINMLVGVSETGRRLARDELVTRQVLGAAAAEQNVPLRTLIDLYLTATWLTWRELPTANGAGGDTVRAIAESVLRAADDAIAALAEGYDGALRVVMRQEEAHRRQFIDDLLSGRSDVGRLAEAAERFGLRLAGQMAVAAVGADRSFVDGDAMTRPVESTLLVFRHPRCPGHHQGRFLLICVASATADEVYDDLARLVRAAMDAEDRWCIGVGRPHAGPAGAACSYEEARETVEMAASLGLTARVLHTTDVLVFKVLLRDRVAIIDLVATVLGPLEQARGGPEPLLDTLAAYFACGGVSAATARRADPERACGHLPPQPGSRDSPETTSPIRPERFTLEAAVLGARLLDWPNRPLPPTH